MEKLVSKDFVCKKETTKYESQPNKIWSDRNFQGKREEDHKL